ncbi:hypothetical protein I7I53_04744 [Histoplasma capsulatum var. duboisii H88]|uniref:Uncharacterized protein n=1 Tax=Ajellomyces capsulatus (strain H88) TaxID=544711 RepID=A0A8A1LRG7_AJEC8|nr:hypothetical protein I7I53_04744 [Histoplasma capsulatum var. duboisii H88]
MPAQRSGPSRYPDHKGLLCPMYVRCCVPLGFGNLKHCQRANFISRRT